MDVPELTTARLRLRGPGLEDAAGMAALWGDPAVVAFIGGRVDGPEAAWKRLLGHVGHWAAVGYGFWTVLDRETGDFLGQAGFFDHRRGLDPALEGVPEAGWVLVRHAHGRGIATEAMRAALDWGDAHLPGSGSFALFHPDHAASVRVASKLGYGDGALLPWKGEEALVMRRASARPPARKG